MGKIREKIELRGKEIECHYDTSIPRLLAEPENENAVILSEAYMRFLSVRSFETNPRLAIYNWNTSNLLAIKGEDAKVILPYEVGSRILTDVSKMAWGWVNPSETLIEGRVNLDIEDRWRKINGPEVYCGSMSEWFEKDEDGKLIGLNEDMTEEQVMKCRMVMTILEHEDYVDSKFARSADEVAETVGRTFRLREDKWKGLDTMMGQYLPGRDDRGILKGCSLAGLASKARSGAKADFDQKGSLFAVGRLLNVKPKSK